MNDEKLPYMFFGDQSMNPQTVALQRIEFTTEELDYKNIKKLTIATTEFIKKINEYGEIKRIEIRYWPLEYKTVFECDVIIPSKK